MQNGKQAYAVKHKNEAVRAASRSGGVFTALTDAVLDAGGVVYGCALDEHFEAEHRRAATREERNTFRGSKYVQSRMGDAYLQVKADLENGTPVLFSGTPCQVDGLLSFLQAAHVDRTKLITLDILCHGVPSPRVWRDYLQYVSNGKAVASVDFRDKTRFGWRDSVDTVVLQEGETRSSKNYNTLFYGHNTLRESCFVCPYKTTQRTSDITIGDYWGIEKLDASLDDDKGVSLVLLNTERGEALWNSCKGNLLVEEFPLALSLQPVLRGNFPRPVSRNAFWADYARLPFAQVLQKYTAPPKPTAKQRIRRLFSTAVKKVVRL